MKALKGFQSLDTCLEKNHAELASIIFIWEKKKNKNSLHTENFTSTGIYS